MILVFRSLQNWKNLGTTSHHNGDVGVAALSFAHLDLSTAFHDKFAAVLFDIRQLIFNPDGAGDSGISCRYMHGYIYIYICIFNVIMCADICIYTGLDDVRFVFNPLKWKCTGMYNQQYILNIKRMRKWSQNMARIASPLSCDTYDKVFGHPVSGQSKSGRWFATRICENQVGPSFQVGQVG